MNLDPIDVMDVLLTEGKVSIEIDPNACGVVIPGHLKEQSHCLLNVSYNYYPHDLFVDEGGVSSTLSFGSYGAFKCFIPWTAVYSMMGERRDEEEDFSLVTTADEKPKFMARRVRGRPWLRLIKGGKS